MVGEVRTHPQTPSSSGHMGEGCVWPRHTSRATLPAPRPPLPTFAHSPDYSTAWVERRPEHASGCRHG